MATSIRSEWTEAKCLRLIREYRARPILWDKKEPYFYKKTMKPKAWREIGNILNISPEKCKHKMGVLMSSFRREKAKIVHKLRDEPDGSRVPNSIWFGFKEMSFLMDKETERKRQSLGMESIDEEEDDEDDSQELPIQLLKHIETHVPPRPQKVLKRTPIKRTLSVLSTQSIQEEEPQASPVPVPVPGPSQTATERNEEISSFTSFIGIKMKKYSDTTKNAVQQAICEIIFKADQNYYESSSSYEKLTVIDDHSDPLDKAIYDAQNGIIKVQSYSDSD